MKRRDVLAAMLGGVAAVGGARIVSADTSSQLPAPSEGGFLSGPLGPSDAMQMLASERPVAMIIEDADVDAEVEINHIVDGQMLDPTGAWVVAWYEGTGMLHEKRRNMLYSGHVDYWGVGPSVFRNLASVPEGSVIHLIGEKGGEAFYAVEFVERVTIAEMTAEKMQQITAPTPYEALTIITCGGAFDYSVGEYLQRDVIRARLMSGQESGTAIATPTEEVASESTNEEAPAGETPTEEAAATVTATVTQNSVNVRPSPSTSGASIVKVNAGDTVTVTGEAVEGDGYTWLPVILDDGTSGYIVIDFLNVNP
ncbi:MAG: SH3 domain-containing protein [Thermomicrobiales bacterium]|nr:SH3 domain-containing protein [Thermomicrobiales bacterium]MCO5225685.1 SH3 domain-containing protein [Thermomicrobiales bacterium]